MFGCSELRAVTRLGHRPSDEVQGPIRELHHKISCAWAAAAVVRTHAKRKLDVREQNGIFYRRAIGGADTKKRQPAVRIPPRLLAHMRRWHRKGKSVRAVIEWNGAPVTKINKRFRSACALAGLSRDVVPHTLGHTCATWLAQRSVPVHEICGFLSMTEEMFNRVYGHHHPDYQSRAVHALGTRF